MHFNRIRTEQPTHIRHERKPESDAPLKKNKKVAVLACHGMGQQICYETLDAVAKAIKTEGESPERREQNITVEGDGSPCACVVRIEDQTLGRFRLKVNHGSVVKQVDLFEAYWAPHTQGKISVKDVIAFLFSSGLNGMKQWARAWRDDGGHFRYRVFGEEQYAPVSAGTPMTLGLLLMIVGLLLLFLISVPVMTLAGVLRHFLRLDESFCHAIVLAVVGSWYVLVPVLLAIFVTAVVAAVRPVFYVMVRFWGAFAFASWVVVAYVVKEYSSDMTTAVGNLAKQMSTGDPAFYILLVTPLVLFLMYLVRYFLVELVGDVAIYVSANTLNRFWAVREQVQKSAADIALALYRAKNGDEPAYDEVIVLGHSLGSVIAYHALNCVLVEESIDKTLNASPRTSLFLTFGSPLDKVLYLFRSQLAGAEVRDAVDNSWAPLASCTERRDLIRWVNIRAPLDFVSGKLDYFDRYPRQESNPPPVEDVVEKDGEWWRRSRWLPSAAHACYWQKPAFRRELFNAILSGPAGIEGKTEAAAVGHSGVRHLGVTRNGRK